MRHVRHQSIKTQAQVNVLKFRFIQSSKDFEIELSKRDFDCKNQILFTFLSLALTGAQLWDTILDLCVYLCVRNFIVKPRPQTPEAQPYPAVQNPK